MSELENLPQSKQLFIKDLQPRDYVQSSFLVKSKSFPLAKNGKPYLSLMLMDKTGELDSRVWENAEALSQQFEEGDVVSVAGRVNSFQNRLQLIVQHLVPLSVETTSVGDYLPEGPGNVDALYAELLSSFDGLNNPWIRDLGLSLLRDPVVEPRYKLCPAAKTIHHAYLGGLLTHSVQLIRLVDAILSHYSDIDRELMIFGAAFHDFGKIFELSFQSHFGYTDEGRLVGHMAIAIALVDRKIQAMPGFPKELEWHLKHLILCHHGHLEYGSPKRPHTIEGELLHHLDNMDSRINSIQTFMKSDRNNSRWTNEHRAYNQYYFKPEKYIEGQGGSSQ